MDPHAFPPLPKIGYPESYYAHHVHEADRSGDVYSHQAFKVAQYITLGLNPHLRWEDKLRYFQHALRRHCAPPPLSDEEVENFYRQLAALVQQHAGQEALRIASLEDDLLDSCLKLGKARQQVVDEAIQFFAKLMPDDDECPQWFTQEDYHQLKVLRGNWVGDQIK